MEIKRNTLLWVVIGALFIVALFLVFQAGASGSVQSVGATAQAAKTAAVSSGGMVGGC